MSSSVVNWLKWEIFVMRAWSPGSWMLWLLFYKTNLEDIKEENYQVKVRLRCWIERILEFRELPKCFKPSSVIKGHLEKWDEENTQEISLRSAE